MTRSIANSKVPRKYFPQTKTTSLNLPRAHTTSLSLVLPRNACAVDSGESTMTPDEVDRIMIELGSGINRLTKDIESRGTPQTARIAKWHATHGIEMANGHAPYFPPPYLPIKLLIITTDSSATRSSLIRWQFSSSR